MSTITELRTALNEFFGENYYYEEAPDDAEYPFRVGFLANSFDDELSEVYSFEVDYWGKKTSDIEKLISEDEGNGNTANPTGLNKWRIPLPSGYAKIDKDNQVSIRDPDATLRRIRVDYSIRLYKE